MSDTVWTERRSGGAHHRPGDQRSPWQRDRARVLHSAAFRRLQAKTQVMSIGENDFYRTRLTHSLEAAQIGAALVEQLQGKLDAEKAAALPAPPLMETLCLAHDLGHPPFGHGGEFALNYRMLEEGGFEGNGQTLRVVARLEPYTDGFGMDLTRRALLGLLKYPIVAPEVPDPPQPGDTRPLTSFKPAKAIFSCDELILDWILAPLEAEERSQFQAVEVLPDSPWGRSRYKSLDASIMELADDIAYGVHDLEDAVVTGTVDRDSWMLDAMARFDGLPGDLRRAMTETSEALFAREHHRRKQAIGALVNRFITAAVVEEVMPEAPTALVRLNARLPEAERALLDILKGFVSDHVIQQPAIQRARYRCQHSLLAMFDAFASEPSRLLPRNTRERWLAAEGQGNRVLCDYLAGMTDDYAQRMHATLFGPG
jgi:dGTPase